MPRLEGGLHGLKADPSARAADDQDARHGVMLPVEPCGGSRGIVLECPARRNKNASAREGRDGSRPRPSER
jgi:hypothetical protein